MYIFCTLFSCCSLLPVDFTNIFQDYFTGVGSIHDSEATLKDIALGRSAELDHMNILGNEKDYIVNMVCCLYACTEANQAFWCVKQFIAHKSNKAFRERQHPSAPRSVNE